MKNPTDLPDETDSDGGDAGDLPDTPSPDRQPEAHEDPEAPSSGESALGVLQVIHDLESRLDSTFSIRQALQGDLDTAHAKIAALQGRNEELLERITFLEARDDLTMRLQLELDSLREEKAGSEQSAIQLQSRVSELSDEKTVLEKDITEAASALAGMKRKAGELQSEVLRLRDASSFEEITDILAETKAKLAQASARVSELETELEAGAAAKDAIVCDLRENQEHVRNLHRAIEELKTNQEDLEKKIIGAFTQITDELRIFL
ncbi:MAG: hypothetical protein ACYS47_08390 [Planctomycetota bacterium]|jgi:chromosome segregation ATPase